MPNKSQLKDYLRKSTLLVDTYKKTKNLTAISKQQLLRIARLKSVMKWKRFNDYVLNQQLDKSDFVPITDRGYSGKHSKQLVAFYLPQYYQIPQNDEWFGRGFTEWDNCAKAVPQFVGHWQPHLPIDTGFYDLETTHAMHRQVELAKMYGIDGFCFYYYWFSGGSKIMEKPVINWLNDKSLDLPFMFFWANEDWTNTWGAQADLGTKTYSAKMKPGDVDRFVDDILPFLQDKRYITIKGRPHIIIYQAKKDPYLPEFIDKIGALLEAKGVKRPYISIVFPDDFDSSFDPRDFGADAAVEFGSHMRVMPDSIPTLTTNNKLINPLAKVTEYDMEKFIGDEVFAYKTSYPVYKGVMTHFDNTARKIYRGAQIFSISPKLYQQWLTRSIQLSQTDQVFITAWNEWAEGMHLEPDQKYGYAYLQATKDALETTE